MLNQFFIKSLILLFSFNFLNREYYLPISDNLKEKEKRTMKKFEEVMSVSKIIYFKKIKLFESLDLSEKEFEKHINCGIYNSLNNMNTQTEKKDFVISIIKSTSENNKKYLFKEIAKCSYKYFTKEQKEKIKKYK